MTSKSKASIFRVFVIAISIFVLLLCLSVFAPFFFGLRPYTITSESMSPMFKQGDIIYVKKVDADSLKKGDIITFKIPNGTVSVTHRVSRIESEENLIYTIGDANSNEDYYPISYEDIIGVYSYYKLPFLRWLY